jgi:hypothetical protein
MADRRALEPLRSYVVDEDALAGGVVEVDATEDEEALAVLQARLHPAPDGLQLVFGYDLSTTGLGGWVGDRKVRLRLWPAWLDDAGEITSDGPDDPDGDVLLLDLDPSEHGDVLRALARTGTLLIAGPEVGPTPVVLALDRELVAEVLAEVGLG